MIYLSHAEFKKNGSKDKIFLLNEETTESIRFLEILYYSDIKLVRTLLEVDY
jgi:hypothetical protein